MSNSNAARIRALEIELHLTRAQRDGRTNLAPTAVEDVASLLMSNGVEITNGALHGPGIVGDDDALALVRVKRPHYFGDGAAAPRVPKIEAFGKGINGSSPEEKIRAANAARFAGVQ